MSQRVTEKNRLVTRILANEQGAFEEFIEAYQGTVRGFTTLWAPSRDEADDIAQEVFLSALRNLKTFDTQRDLNSWLIGIARNLTRQSWHRFSARAKHEDREAFDSALEQHALQTFQAREGQGEKRKRALRKCIEILPLELKETFSEYVLGDMSSEQLADKQETSPGTVRANISRIRRRLRYCIERRLRLEGSV